jgi:hypothetical protein
MVCNNLYDLPSCCERERERKRLRRRRKLSPLAHLPSYGMWHIHILPKTVQTMRLSPDRNNSVDAVPLQDGDNNRLAVHQDDLHSGRPSMHATRLPKCDFRSGFGSSDVTKDLGRHSRLQIQPPRSPSCPVSLCLGTREDFGDDRHPFIQVMQVGCT